MNQGSGFFPTNNQYARASFRAHGSGSLTRARPLGLPQINPEPYTLCDSFGFRVKV